jgi:hypothetical protein
MLYFKRVKTKLFLCGYRAYNPSWIIQLHPLNIVDYQIIIVGNVFENKELLEMVHNTIIC